MAQLPLRIGPYRPLSLLGQGGMGVVYLCEHTAKGHRVAVKTLRAQDGYRMISIRREMQALAALDHPGVVRFLGRGVQDGLPWYAMALVDGVSLRRLLHPPDVGVDWSAKTRTQPEAPKWGVSLASCIEATLREATSDGHRKALARVQNRGLRIDAHHRLPLSGAVNIVCQLCAALSYVHGEGIVHRDLKPENVIVDAGGHPVLVDFGVTAFYSGGLGRETVDGPSGLAGTVGYMAPEQIRGEFVDARADLYALGCILFELVTGHPPFVGNDTAVLQAHAHEAPRSPAAMVEDVPEPLDRLILGLLEKKPSNRVGYAEDVRAALLELGATPGPQGPSARTYLYRPRLSGRADVLSRLSALVRDGEGGGLALVTGEAGVGKTRLATELISLAESKLWNVWTGVCTPLAKGAAITLAGTCPPLDPLRPLLHAISDRCIVRGADETRRLLGDACRLLAAYESSLRAVPGFADHEKPAPLPLAEARSRLFTGLTDVLRRLSEETPILLVLDDLHCADELTLGWLSHLESSGVMAQFPAVVVGLARGAESGETLAVMSHSPGVVSVALERLDAAAIHDMVSSMLAMPHPPPRFVAFLTQQSEGNPFFVAEYLRTAVVRGLLERGSDGRWRVANPADSGRASADLAQSLPLPRGLQALLHEQVTAVSLAARRVLGAAAVLGPSFDPTTLVHTLGLPEQELEAFLDRLEELRFREIVRPVEDSRLWRFAHGLLAEIAYADLDDDRRRLLHGNAAEALRSSLDSGVPGDLAAVARHLERAGSTDEARSAYFEAARVALDVYALDDASRLFWAGLQLVHAPSIESVRAQISLAEDVEANRGDLDTALRLAERATADAIALGEDALETAALRARGIVLTRMGRLEEALQSYEGALARDRRDERMLEEGVDLARVATIHSYQGRIEAARECFERALAVFDRVGHPVERSKVLINLAIIRRKVGDFDGAEALNREALAVSRQLSLHNQEGIILNNIALMLRQRGEVSQARRLYSEALAVLRRGGNRVVEASAVANLGHLELQRGDFAEADTLLNEALVLCRTTGNRRTEALVLVNLAELALLRGALERAEPHLTKARELAVASGSPRTELLAIAMLSEVRFDQCRADEALALIGEARALVDTARLPRLTVYIAVIRARQLRLTGERRRARAALARARRAAKETLAPADEGLLECEMGHLAGSTKAAATHLDRARQIAARLEVLPGSRLGRAIEGLRRAIEGMGMRAPDE